MRTILLRASKSPWMASQARRRKFVGRAVRRFMPGETIDDAIEAARTLETRGIPTVLTQLGENVDSATAVGRVVDHYRRVVDRAVEENLDLHVSVKPTHLGLDLGEEVCRGALDRLRRHALDQGVPLWIDMEDSSYVERTLDLYLELLTPGAPFGLCLQAYLRRTPEDLEAVLEAGGTVRLVKGAYREPADLAHQQKGEVDEAFVRLAARLSEEARSPSRNGELRHALGTHDLRLLEEIPGGPEIQMLYGIRTPSWDEVRAQGTPFRVLVSYGEHWYPWYMRRLAERPANLGFLLRSLLPGGR